MELLKGISAYEGVVIGEPYVDIINDLESIKMENITSDNVIKEKDKLISALKKSIDFLKSLKKDLGSKIDKKELGIIDAHLLFLEDPIYIKEIEKNIEKKLKVEIAIEKATEKFVKMFENMDNEVFKQRAMDIKDVSKRVIENLKENNKNYKKYENKILITREIFPTELLHLYKSGINLKGIIMENGGETSHLAILAKSLKIPTLMGVKNISLSDWNGNMILDTTENNGCVIISPTEKELKKYLEKQKKMLQIIQKIEKVVNLPSVTADGKNINLYLNVGDMEDENLTEINLDTINGVGLLRTEFIYMKSKDFPNEDKQYKIYKKLAENFSKNHIITVRTLDIGADKQLDYFEMERESNPFLGLRGLRFSLKNKKSFKEQLRAILKLSAEKKVRIMYPMVTNVSEVKEANLILEEVKKELQCEKIKYDENIKVGIMVEVPSVVMLADIFAKEVDFFSIGSNDLTQYILATDRLSETVNDLYDTFNPAVLRGIAKVADIAKESGKEISVCGEIAGNLKGIIALLSLGIKNLSMTSSSILRAKALIRSLKYEELKEIKEKILNCTESNEVKKILKKYVNYDLGEKI